MKSFRHWVSEIWHEHKKEILDITKAPCEYDERTYFHMYKWWLKREYKSRYGR